MYPRQYSSDLSSAASLSDADLEANRNGYLTSWQVDNLPFKGMTSEAERQSFGSAVRAAATTIAGAVMALAFFAFLLGSGAELTRFIAPNVRPAATGLIILAVLCSMAWVAYSAVTQRKAVKNWESARQATLRVDAAQGRVQPVMDRVDGHERHYVQIGSRRFRTDRRTFAAFQPNESYRVYYVNSPDGYWMVNAEDLSEQ
jgi:hypothetical protein